MNMHDKNNIYNDIEFGIFVAIVMERMLAQLIWKTVGFYPNGFSFKRGTFS